MAQNDLTLTDVQASVTDLATSIADLAKMTADMIGATEERLTGELNSFKGELSTFRGELNTLRQETDAGFSKMYHYQREANERLEKLEASNETIVNDIHAMYEMLGDLQSKGSSLSKDDRRRLADLEAFAMQVAEKTGVPFTPKPKLRS